MYAGSPLPRKPSMSIFLRIRHLPLIMALALTGYLLPSNSRAQTYPIDCAILLCLSGGWPASVPCARARVEFIRRITPWPIEPPLQIWRCPMGASYEFKPQPNETNRIFDALFQTGDMRPHQSFPATLRSIDTMKEPAVWRFDGTSNPLLPPDIALRLVQDHSDIDISGPEFNFVRSIRVFDVFIDDDRDDGDCDRYARVRLGSYGAQGEFSWRQSNRSAIPTDFGPTRSGCSLRARAVFVEWRDYHGNYGFERVNY